MPFANSVPDVRLVQPVACRMVPKWSPGRCCRPGVPRLLEPPGIFMGEISCENMMLACYPRYEHEQGRPPLFGTIVT